MNKVISKIYFLKAGDHIKIGVTDGFSIKHRIAALQTGNPIKIELLGIMLGGYDIEKKLHKKFSSFRKEGEWFHYSDEIKEFIDNFALTSIEEIRNLEQKEVSVLESEEKERAYSNKLKELEGSIEKLAWVVYYSFRGIADIYRQYNQLENKMFQCVIIEEMPFKPHMEDAKKENIYRDSPNHREFYPYIRDNIYKTFRHTIQAMTDSNWRNGDYFLSTSCGDDKKVRELINETLKRMNYKLKLNCISEIIGEPKNERAVDNEFNLED